MRQDSKISYQSTFIEDSLRGCITWVFNGIISYKLTVNKMNFYHKRIFNFWSQIRSIENRKMGKVFMRGWVFKKDEGKESFYEL